MVSNKSRDHRTFDSPFSMANTTSSTEYPSEKELSTSFPSQTYEDSKSPELELPGTAFDQKDQREIKILDDTDVKSTPEPSEQHPVTPVDSSGNVAELPAEPAVEQPGPTGDYSILTVAQKRTIVITASFAALFSPMATAIYCECSVIP